MNIIYIELPEEYNHIYSVLKDNKKYINKNFKGKKENLKAYYH